MAYRKRLPVAVLRAARNGPPPTPFPATLAFVVITTIYLVWELLGDAPAPLGQLTLVSAGIWFNATCKHAQRAKKKRRDTRRYGPESSHEDSM